MFYLREASLTEDKVQKLINSGREVCGLSVPLVSV